MKTMTDDKPDMAAICEAVAEGLALNKSKADELHGRMTCPRCGMLHETTVVGKLTVISCPKMGREEMLLFNLEVWKL